MTRERVFALAMTLIVVPGLTFLATSLAASQIDADDAIATFPRSCPLTVFLDVDISSGWRAVAAHTRGLAQPYIHLTLTLEAMRGDSSVILLDSVDIPSGLSPWLEVLDTGELGILDVGDAFIAFTIPEIPESPAMNPGESTAGETTLALWLHAGETLVGATGGCG